MNFAVLIQTAALLFNLIPIIITAMKSVEESMGALVPGAVKLEVVRLGLQAAYDAEQSLSKPFADIWPTIAGIISTLKASPLFPKTTP